MKVVAIIQARLGSVRFPGKVLRSICGTPLIGLLLQRLSRSEEIDQIVLAVPESSRNEPLAQYVSAQGYTVFRGSESDVLDRYYQAAKLAQADVVIRITGDCPLIDPAVVDAVVRQYLDGGVDYVSTGDPRSFPNGLDTEVFSFAILERAWKEASDSYSREHVTPFIRTQPGIVRGNYAHSTDESSRRWTVDEPEDFEVVSAIFEHFHPRVDFGWLEVLSLQTEFPEKFQKNQHIPYNEGASMGVEQKLMRRASRVLLNATGSLSNQSGVDILWPKCFKEAKGCKLRGLDDREYLDMSSPGIRKRILGYAHPEVDEAVIAAIRSGGMSALNEEVLLAERLIELHPWADVANFQSSEVEAHKKCIEIGQRASGRDGVAVCGYLSSEPCGGAARFSPGKLEELEAKVSLNELGVIMVDLANGRNCSGEWLKEVREFASCNNVILVFDEIRSGFRSTFGGLHKTLGVEPDIAVFGETLGNGYPITATVGRREIVECAYRATFGNQSANVGVGAVAALKTLEVMERDHPWDVIASLNKQLCKGWSTLGEGCGIPLDYCEKSGIAAFSLHNHLWPAREKRVVHEMFRYGILAANQIFANISHTSIEVDKYLERLTSVFGTMRDSDKERSDDSSTECQSHQAGFPE